MVKNLAITFTALLLLSACGMNKLEIPKAKACAEGLLEAVKTEHYQDLGKYYSNAYNENESTEQRSDKLKQLKEALGAITTYQLTDSMTKGNDGEQALVLTYKVSHTKVTTIEKFVIVKDEGEYRVMGHDIKTEN